MRKAMMQEILGVTDEPGIHRRWFHDDYFDLFVWQVEGGELVQFQLCYGIDSSEQALVWEKRGGFFLDGADPGKAGKGKVLGREATPPRRSIRGGTLRRRVAVSSRGYPARHDARVHEFVEEEGRDPGAPQALPPRVLAALLVDGVRQARYFGEWRGESRDRDRRESRPRPRIGGHMGAFGNLCGMWWSRP